MSKLKPIVALKSGRTKGGSEAAASHTKSIAGRDEIFGAALEKAGMIRVDTVEELYDVSKALSMLRLPTGNRVLIITTSGGIGILAVDACENAGLELPQLSPKVVDLLKSKLPDQCVVRNPLDLTTAGFDPEVFANCIRDVEEEPYDMILTVFGDPIEDVSKAMGKAVNETSKVVVVMYMGGAELEKSEMLKLHSLGIPVFPTPERAVRAIRGLCQYASWRGCFT
jgi:acyl-CoA synthetase (NDP forming)